MGFYGQCFFCGFCEFLRPVLFLLILLVLYIAKVACDYMVWILNRGLWCGLLSFSFRAFLFDFDLLSLLMGALRVEVDFSDLEAYLFFAVFFFW